MRITKPIYRVILRLNELLCVKYLKQGFIIIFAFQKEIGNDINPRTLLNESKNYEAVAFWVVYGLRSFQSALFYR